MINFLGVPLEYCDRCEIPFIRCHICNANSCGACGCKEFKNTLELWFEYIRENRSKILYSFRFQQRAARQSKIQEQLNKIRDFEIEIDYCQDRIKRFREMEIA